MTKAVIFDVDGTLIDTVDLHAQCWVDALKHFGVEVPFEDMRVQIGKGGDQILQGLLPPEMLASRGEEIQAFRSEMFKRDYMHRARAFPGVRELFERIRAAGQKAVLASSGTAGEVETYKQIAGIADLIDGATSSDDAERSKPFPDIFQAALARLAPLRAQDAIVVETDGYPYALLLDSVEDVLEYSGEVRPIRTALDAGWRRVAKGVVDVEGDLLLLVDTGALLGGPTAVAA